MAYGDVECKICKKYLGNYVNGNGNYFRLIRLKYCDKCKPMILNQQKRMSAHSRRHGYKQVNAELMKQLELFQKQNELLQKQNEFLREEVNAMYE